MIGFDVEVVAAALDAAAVRPELLAALRRDLHEAELTARECRLDDAFLPAIIAEERAARLEQRIAALEAEMEGAPA